MAFSLFKSILVIMVEMFSLFKSIFSEKKNNGSDDGENSWPISLSPLANSVVYRCSKIIGVSTKELEDQFDMEFPDLFPSSKARNFLEFCSFKALHLYTSRPKYLNDKEFRRLTFDIMIAWESPGLESDLMNKETVSCIDKDVVGKDGSSAVQVVDDKETVGKEAFARIAPACSVIADITTVDNLFYVLTSALDDRLHFPIYNNYLKSLREVAKSMQNAQKPNVVSKLSLAEDEVIVHKSGTNFAALVFRHIGMSAIACSGRLTLTNYALYFEPGLLSIYGKAVRYDLATEMKQVIKPCARGFNKAVMYKSTSISEPVYFIFPQFEGCSRRDYWLDNCLEILRAHKFTRKYNMKGNQQSEVLARAILGIFRFRAVRKAFHISPSNYKTLLCFNLAEFLSGGDIIKETLSSRLKLISPSVGLPEFQSSPNANRQHVSPAALVTLIRLKIISDDDVLEEIYQGGDVFVGELNPLETVVKQLKQNAGTAEAAQATVDQVKVNVEGIGSKLAVVKELLFPVIKTCNRLLRLASWDKPYKSTMFVLFFSYMIFREWVIRFMLPSILVYLALVMLWRSWKRRPLETFQIVVPPSSKPLEQLFTLQEAITDIESRIHSANIILLKLRALLFAASPQATIMLAVFFVLVAAILAFVPTKYLILIVFLEYFTRNMPLRKESCERGDGHESNWLTGIPAAPVQLIKADDKKRK